ncbi:patatin-like phospholipase family protein [Bdellovibrio sp. SKB1291214]|uniref:patatin-like phospholipase family protein n=1 Tax=Bdellovibrio sp. SKB1291214 TaxID=1732569 RepID=UPI0022401F97|nr:patatin-like phospholipase family protein [Bdellovibrio sp. SKB1291214]UYL08142.1 patatin-like phospholipase family protein [Bdellovibrio sp. SKB1291214]
MMSNLGLVLSGGGARGAYQVGVLTAVAEICRELSIDNPFGVFTGVSAGAINACALTSHPGCFHEACDSLRDIWGALSSDDVFESDPLSVTGVALHWLMDLSSGGLKRTPGKSLLNTSPLRNLISKNCRFENIQKKINEGIIRGVGISALDFHSSSTVTFIQGAEDIELWERVRRQAVRSQINVDHVMASSAIPVLFPAIAVDSRYYGDGSIRNFSPCAPAIYMGAERLLAIGVRRQQEACYTSPEVAPAEAPSVARVASVLLHALMSDGIEFDIERIERINLAISKIHHAERKKLTVKPIDVLWISPSRDFSEIAAQHAHELPRMIRYLLRGLGGLEESAELSSFLLFEENYVQTLLEIGYEDGRDAKQELIQLLTGKKLPDTIATSHM